MATRANQKQMDILRSLEWPEEGLVGATRSDLGKWWPSLLGALLGVSKSYLKDSNLDGTHCWRHLAEVGALLDWPAREIAVIGDWAPGADPEEDEDAPSQAKKRPRAASKGRVDKSVVQKPTSRVYHANATAVQQVAVRRRLMAAIRAGFARFGVEKIVLSTTWAEIFPELPPPELEEFYGKRVRPSTGPPSEPSEHERAEASGEGSAPPPPASF